MGLLTERPRIDPTPPESKRLNDLERVIAITPDDSGRERALVYARNNPDGTMVIRVEPLTHATKVYVGTRKVWP